MSTTVVQGNPSTKRHGVKLSLSMPDLRHFSEEPNPHGSSDRLSLSANSSDDASLTQLPSTQKIRRKRYGSSPVTFSSGADSSKLGSSSERVGIKGDLVQPQPVPTNITIQRSMSVDCGIAFNLNIKSPASASVTSGSTTYPLPHNSFFHSRPSVALHDDANAPRLAQCEIQKQNSLDRPTSNLNSTTSTTSTQLPEFTPFSPAFGISFYHAQSSSPTQYRFGSTVSLSNSSTSSLPRVSLAPSPSPSRVSFVQPPKSAIPAAIAPPRRSSLYLGPLISPPSPASSHFSRHTVSSSHHASTSSLPSGSHMSVSSLPPSPLTPSIPVTPPPEVLKRKRLEKLERTLGVQGVGNLSISASGSRGVQEPGPGQGRDKTGNDIRDRPSRLDSLSSPSERAIIAPWDATPPPGSFSSAKPKSLMRKLTKSKPPPSPQARVQQSMEPTSDPKLKIKRVPAPIVIIPTLPSRRSLTSNIQAVNGSSHEQPGSNSLSHENSREGSVGATIAKPGSTPAILLSPPPSGSPTHFSPASSHSRSHSSPSSASEDASSSSCEEGVPPRSRSASVSSVSYAPTSPARTPHPDRTKRARPKDYGMQRRSRSVSHIYSGSRREGIRGLNADLIVPPLPTSPLTPSSTGEANITGALKSLDGYRISGDRIRGDPRVAEKDGDEAKAAAGRRKIDSLGNSLKSPSQSSLTSQRYIKPATRALLSSPSSSSLPHGSSTTLVASFSSPAASSSTLNLPMPVPSVPAIPKIHLSRQDQPQGKSLKRSTSFSLLKMSRGRKEEVDDRNERAEKDGRQMDVVDAAEEWRAQLQRSEREVSAGFNLQSSGQQSRPSAPSSQPPIHSSSQPASRSASRTPSRQPSRSNISIGPVHVSPPSYFPPPSQDRAQANHVIPFSGTSDASKGAEVGILKPREEYGRVDNRVRGHGWSGEWNLPLEEVIKGLRTIQSS